MGADDPASNFAAIGDEEGLDHFELLSKMRFRILKTETNSIILGNKIDSIDPDATVAMINTARAFQTIFSKSLNSNDNNSNSELTAATR